MNKITVQEKLDAIQRLDNNTYYYNYLIDSYNTKDLDGNDIEMNSYILVHLSGAVSYKDCVRSIIREYISLDEEFDMINSYAKSIISGTKDTTNIKEYSDYLELLELIKDHVKEDLNLD